MQWEFLIALLLQAWQSNSMTQPRYRLAVTAPLSLAATLTLEGNPAHYVQQVVRLKVGDALGVFNRTDGEWAAEIVDISKRAVALQITKQLRTPSLTAPQLTVCFAPIKGGRLETIIEKATELGATVLQPVLTQRTIVDKINLERAEALAREAAEQCERIEWPEIKPLIKLPALLGSWSATAPLLYGDETGESSPITEVTTDARPTHWGILVGPEGGFTPEEFALLKRVPSAKGVSLGPRILRADTAVITLCALTLAAWGDWDQRPRFIGA